jgi:hypothetical protein
MPERIAIKVLTGSDLTFFDSIFKKKNIGGNQKSINLNADVFVSVLYPNIGAGSLGRDVEIPVRVTVFGPLPGKAYKFARSIAKGKKYKNWRLNGAAVPDPEDELGKFDGLNPGDVAVIEFHGDAKPEAVSLVIISQRHDPRLLATLASETGGGRQSMVAVSRRRLFELAESLKLSGDHPIRALLEDPELDGLLEEAQSGAEPAVRRLRERTGRKVTKAEIEAARERAARVGSDGEALAHVLLMRMVRSGHLTRVVWASEENAAASWDFEIEEEGGKVIRLDAKSTTRTFEGSSFFLSAAEAAAASNPSIPYRILRMSDLTDDGAAARFSEDINDLAASIVRCTDKLPVGTSPTGFCLSVDTLKWNSPVSVERPDQPEE